MKKNIFLISLLSVFVFTGCNGFVQDPFKDKEEAIRNAVPPTTKVEGTRAMSPGAAKIIVVSETAFEEGVEGTITMQAELFLEGYIYTLSIKNINEFPGARFDANTGKFSWTPPAGTVTNGHSVQKFILNAEILATPKSAAVGEAPLNHVEPIDVHVENSQQKPSVRNVQFSNGSISNRFFEEGTIRYLIVSVEDLDSGGTNAPTLIFQGRSGLKSLAEYTSQIGSPRYDSSRKQWDFDIKIDLSVAGADLTKSADEASLVISAQSRAGMNSLPYASLDFTVLMKFGSAVSNLPVLGVEVKANVLNTIPFVISDSNNEAALTIGSARFLPTGAQINCENSTRPFQLCTLTWTPSAMDVGRSFNSSIPVEMRNPNTLASDPRVSPSNVNVIIRVVP